MCHSGVQNGPFLVKSIITFIYLLALLIVQNLKHFLQQIHSYEDAPFLGPKWSICPNFFLYKIINIILIYLLAPFIVQNFLKIFSGGSKSMRMPNFWAQNVPFAQMRTFSENMLMSLVSLIHAYLHPKN